MAVSFNGSTDYIDMGVGAGSLQFANNAPMSMCCWINFASFSGTQEFLGYGFNSGDTGYFFQTTGVGGNLLVGSFTASTTFGASWAFTWTTNIWHHCYGEFNSGTGQWKLYADGVLVASSATSTTGPVQVFSRSFVAGAANISATPTYAQFFNGCMADAAVFNGPLTGTEITNLANGTVRPNTGMSQTLLGYWKMDTAAATQTDFSTFGNTGTAVAGAITNTCGTSPSFTASTLILMGQICA